LRALLLLSCLGCDRPNFVELVPVELGDDPISHSGGPAGFSCRTACPCADGVTACSCLLFQRAADEARPSPRGAALDPDFGGTRAAGSAVVDLLSIGPGPSDANPFVVIARCTNDPNVPCVPVLRQCFPLDLTAIRDAVDREGGDASGTLLDDVFLQLHASGALVSTDAPDQEVLVRMVTTTLTCDQIKQRPLRFSQWAIDDPATHWGAAIFGCGYAGPFHLDSVHGEVFLGLPTLDPVSCIQQLAVCAADFDPRQASALLGPLD
jgi:hypothetical protein